MGSPIISNSTILTTYYVGLNSATEAPIRELVFGNLNKQDPQNIKMNENQIVNVDIDKSKDNERGMFSLTITKKDEVI